MKREIIIKVTVEYDSNWTDVDTIVEDLTADMQRQNEQAASYEHGVQVGPVEVISVGQPVEVSA